MRRAVPNVNLRPRMAGPAARVLRIQGGKTGAAPVSGVTQGFGGNTGWLNATSVRADLIGRVLLTAPEEIPLVEPERERSASD